MTDIIGPEVLNVMFHIHSKIVHAGYHVSELEEVTA